VAEKERDAIENRMAERPIASTIELNLVAGIEPSPGEMIGFGSKGHSFRRQSTSQVDLHHLGPNPAI
jgi:hypothetical protein